MAWGNFLLDIGMDSATPLTQFYAVKYSAPEQVTAVTTIADVIAGFSQFGLLASEIPRGKGCSCRVHGVTEAVAVGPIAVGNMVTLEVDGRVSAYVAASGKRIVGKCVGHPSTNAGDRISLLIEPVGMLA
jgi:hypothetical protein